MKQTYKERHVRWQKINKESTYEYPTATGAKPVP